VSVISEGTDSAAHRCGDGRALRLFFFWVTLLLGSGAVQAQSTPYIPDSADVVLQQVPPTTDPRVRHFNQLRAELSRQPHDTDKAVALARAYVDYGRSTGDARYLGRAMAVIQPHMQAAQQPPVSVLLVHATILQSMHFFQDSRDELARILQRAPDNVQAWLTMATVAMVQGDEDLANRACVRLANLSGDFMGIVCTASLRSVTGHGEQAYVLLKMVEDPGPKAPPAIRAWLEGLLADVAARLGRADQADAHFRQALQWAPGDNFLLAEYGEFLLDQGRPREAMARVSGDQQSDTSLLVLVAAETALALPQAAADVAEMDARFRSMAQRGDHVFLREQSAYLLHIKRDPHAALAIAKQNWQVQRAPKDVRVFLEAALAAHDPAAAAPVLAFITRTQLSDVTIDPLVAQLRAAAPAELTSTGR
jgi:cytochrome c-type biogenesis protein CcmH/NrfG